MPLERLLGSLPPRVLLLGLLLGRGEHLVSLAIARDAIPTPSVSPGLAPAAAAAAATARSELSEGAVGVDGLSADAETPTNLSGADGVVRGVGRPIRLSGAFSPMF